MKKPLIEDISTLSFPPGSIRPMTDSRYNYVSLLQKGLDNIGVAFPNPGTAAKADIIDDVSDFSTYNNGATDTLFIKEPIRGGQFFLYTGLDAVDDGMVFLDGDGNKWKRTVQDGVVNGHWYGMEPYVVGRTNQENDSYDKFMAAVAYIYAHTDVHTLYIPDDTRGQAVYFFLTTITLDKDITIIGDGALGAPLTTLLWNSDVPCFFLDSNNGAHIDIKNVLISQATSVTNNRAAHGIESRTFVHLYNVAVNEVAGNGVHIEACGVPGPIYGNADQSILESVQTFTCWNGLYISGCDANVIDVNNCSFVSNKRWGIYDNGFLGNLFRNCHFANNGKDFLTIVTFGGLYYASADVADNLNKRPDLFPAYWYEIDPMGGAAAWASGTQYYSGGVAMVADVNAFSKFDHCYTESFQPPVVLNTRSSYEGGTLGATVMGGALMRVLNGTYIIYTSDGGGAQVDKLGVGQSTGTSTLCVTSQDNLTAHLTSATSLLQIRMSNSVDDYGGISYFEDKILLTADGGYVATLGATAFTPYTNALLDLGTPALKWNSINAVNARLSGITEFSGNATAISGGLVAGDMYRTGEFLKIVF